MQGEKLIQITKKDGSKHIVPAGQRTIYESFNARAKKLRRDKDLVTIDDYEEPKKEETPAGTQIPDGDNGSGSGLAAGIQTPPPAIPPAPPATNGNGKKPAVEVIELIGNSTTVEAVEALKAGEDRVSVIKAADLKIEELSK